MSISTHWLEFFLPRLSFVVCRFRNVTMDQPLTPFTDRVAAALIRWRYPLLVVAVVLLAASTWLARDIKFDQTIESLYAYDDPHLRDYLESKRLFGGDEFLIVAWREPGLFSNEDDHEDELTESSRKRIEALTDKLNAVAGVNAPSTQNLITTLRFADALPISALRTKVLAMVTGSLVNEDRDVTAIFLRLTPEKDSDKRAATFRNIRSIADAHDPPAYVAGEPLHVHDMFRYVQEDGALLFKISFVLLSAVLLILFRSVRWILLPAAIVALSIQLTYGVLVVADVPLSMVSAILNSLVTIIGVATVTHVAVHYREYRHNYAPEESLRRTLALLLSPIFWTCATTAVGFLALVSSQISPVRSFGLMMSLASMLVFLSSVMILPGGVLMFARWRNDPREAPAEQQLVSLLDRVFDFVRRYPWGVSTALAASIVVLALGLTRLTVETDFSKNFRESSPLVQSLRFVETELGGAGTLEVNFNAPSELTDEFIDGLANLSGRIRDLEYNGEKLVTQANSLDQGIDLFPKIKFLPFLPKTPRQKLDFIARFQPEFEPSLYNRKEHRTRIFLRAYEQRSAEHKNQVIRQVRDAARETHPEAKVSGTYVLLTFLVDSLLSDQIVSFTWAAIGLTIVMTLAFRSLLYGVIGLLPNIFPIVLVIGGMGWANVPINIGTAMITCVSMGLTVDSSIHYLASYRRERRLGIPADEAISHTNRDVGRALVFANLALVAGFVVLTFSKFIPLVYFGFLVGAAMTGGLLGNLLLLPVLLRFLNRWMHPEPQTTDE